MPRESSKSLPLAFGVHVEEEPSAVRVRLSGEFDSASKERLDSKLGEVLARIKPDCMVMDLGGLTFIDSSGLRAIMELYGRSRDDGFDFVLLPGPKGVQDVFELTGLNRVLPLMDGADEHR
jgi:stage II sporulation protein AA (anti-sigma F factor antagonist)